MRKSTKKKTEAPWTVYLVGDAHEAAKAGQHGISSVTQSMRRFLRTTNRYARQSSAPPWNWPINSSLSNMSSTAASCAARTAH
jgi:hypothetical protein